MTSKDKCINHGFSAVPKEKLRRRFLADVTGRSDSAAKAGLGWGSGGIAEAKP